MTVVPPRVAVPFLLALVGVLFMLGVVVGRVFGPVAVGVYGALLIGPVVAAGLQARRRTVRLAKGRACTCCTGTVHDPVRVI